MKQYIGNPNDDCFFYRCNVCLSSFLIEEEKNQHQSRCISFKALEKLSNIEQ